MQKIPQADLGNFLSKNPNEQKAFVENIGNAFQEIGFLALKGHFLDAELQKSLYKEIKACFAL